MTPLAQQDRLQAACTVAGFNGADPATVILALRQVVGELWAELLRLRSLQPDRSTPP